MKRIKKIASLLLALVMVFAMTLTAFAAEATPTTGSDATGSITINDSSTVSVAGKTFNAYKILDVKLVGNNRFVYTVPTELKSFYTERYGLTGDEGDFDAQVVEKINAETDMFAFAKAALAAAKTANITPGTATAGKNVTSVTIGNLPLGYYVVEDVGTATPISALMLDTTKPNVDITIKADQPSIDKKIDGNKDTDDNTTGDVKNNNAAVGDTVPYKVTSKVPDMTGYTKYYFVVNDTLSKGLDFNEDVAITVGTKTLVKDTDYTVTTIKNADGTTSVKIVFKDFIQYKSDVYKDAAITITYSANVNENAAIGIEGNPNKVTLTYSNNPNVNDEGDSDEPGDHSPVGETPEKETRTFVTGIELIKVDPNGNRLTGAEFKLEGTKLNTVLVRTDVYIEDASGAYWKLKDGSYTTDDPNAEGMDQTKYESITTKYAKSVNTEKIVKEENVTYTGTVGEDGILRFEGLSAGEYKITEIKAPNGYNLLKDPITVTIGFTAPAEPFTDCAWTYTWITTDNNKDNVTSENNVNRITVTNNTGTELPSTGGTGTTLFYLIGGILVLIAGVLLVTKKRMSMEK